MTSLYWMTPSLFCHFLSPFLTTSSPSPFPVDVIFELPHTVAIITSFERFSWVTKLFSKVQINVSVKNVFFVRVCVCACVRACTHARARVCVHAREIRNWFLLQIGFQNIVNVTNLFFFYFRKIFTHHRSEFHIYSYHLYHVRLWSCVKFWLVL